MYKGFLPVTAACDTPDMMEVAAATFALFSIMGTELAYNWMLWANSASERLSKEGGEVRPEPPKEAHLPLLCLCLADLRRKSTRQSELQATHGRCPQFGGGCQCS